MAPSRDWPRVRFPSALWPLAAQLGGTYAHQQQANMPLLRSTTAATSSNVSGGSAFSIKVGLPATNFDCERSASISHAASVRRRAVSARSIAGIRADCQAGY